MTRIAEFTLLEELSDARHGSMWRATDAAGSRRVLRQIDIQDDDHRSRIETLVETARGLDHPRLVLPSALVSDENDWLVEPWVDGHDLRELLPPDSPLTLRQRLGVVRAVLSALAYAHEHDLVHGNLSPRTILIDSAGRPTVVGLGVSAAVGLRARRDAYASPEARTGQPRTAASDVYSVAAVIEDLLSDADAVGGELGIELAAAVRPVLDEARRSRPDDRQRNAGALLGELSAVVEPVLGENWWTLDGMPTVAGEDEDRPTTVIRRVSSSRSRRQPWYRQRRLLAIASAAAAVLLTGTAALALNRPDDVPTTTTTPTPSPAVSVTPSSSGSVSSPSPSPTPSPSAPSTTAPPPQAGFTGTYRYVAVTTEATNSTIKVGTKTVEFWKVRTRCEAAACSSVVKPGKGKKFTLGADLTTTRDTTARCIDLNTAEPNGIKITMAYRRTLVVKRQAKNRVTTLVGTDTYRQLKKCPGQTSPRVQVVNKITIRLTKPSS